MQIINDAESLLRFRNELYVLVEDLENNFRTVESQISELNETWKDEQFQKFSNDFDEDKQEIRPLGEKVKDFADDYLYRKEQKIREWNE